MKHFLDIPDLHPAGFQHNGLPGRIRLFKGGDIIGWASDQLDNAPDVFSNPGQALANLDDSVNDVVPGGWGTVAAAAVAVATMGSSLLAEAAVEGGAATVGAVTDAAVTDAAATAAADTAAQAAAAQAAADAAVAEGATDAAATAAADTAAADAAAVEAATPLPPLDATPPFEAPIAPDVPIETPPVEAPVAPEVPTTPPVDTVPPPGELPPVEAPVAPEVPTTPPVDTVPPPGELPPVETPPVDTVPPPVAPPPVETPPPVEAPPVETPPPETPPATEQPPGARVTDPVTGNTTTTFEDGSTLTTNAAGDVVSSTNATSGLTNPLASIVSGVKNAVGAVNPYLTGAVAGQMLLGGNKQATPGNNNGYAGQAAWEWGQATPPVTPGLNPGFVGKAASVPFYNAQTPTQSQYYWGAHPYAATADDLLNYNTIPTAPATPWGQAHSAVGGTDQFNPANFVNQYILNPQYAGVNSGTSPGLAPNPNGPIAPGQIPG